MSLLFYTDELKIKGCCAKPENEVRAPTLADIRAWLAIQGMVVVDQTTWTELMGNKKSGDPWFRRDPWDGHEIRDNG